MNSKERMAVVRNGKKPDRVPFLPTILEHSARIIGKTPSEAACSIELLHKAQVSAYNVYGQDAVTVGIDIYNIEAEALGCEIKFHKDNSIPGVIGHPYEHGYNDEPLEFDRKKGRTGLLLEAAAKTAESIGDKVNVGLAICGPFSICMELLGYESMIMGCIEKEPYIHRILNKVLEYQKSYCDVICESGLGITMFESWATPPLVSPEVYKEYAAPYEKELIHYIRSRGVPAIPLVIGGNTYRILEDIIDTGTSLIIADYQVDTVKYIESAAKKGIIVRGNIDPKLVERGPRDEIIASARSMLHKAGDYPGFVLGTGVIAYDTPPENILCIKNYLEQV